MIKHVICILISTLFLQLSAQEVIPGVDRVNSPESKVVYVFLTAFQPYQSDAKAKPSIAPSYLQEHGFTTDEFKPNMYNPDRFTILEQEGQVVSAIIHSHDSYWAHKVSFNVVKEANTYYILPTANTASDYGYFDPWLSIVEDTKEEASLLRYGQYELSTNSVIIRRLNDAIEKLDNEDYHLYMMQAVFNETMNFAEEDGSHYQAQKHILKTIPYIKSYRNDAIIPAKKMFQEAYDEAIQNDCSDVIYFLDLAKKDFEKMEDLWVGLEGGLKSYAAMEGSYNDKADKLNYELSTRYNDFIAKHGSFGKALSLIDPSKICQK